jgi:hypothetical protein
MKRLFDKMFRIISPEFLILIVAGALLGFTNLAVAQTQVQMVPASSVSVKEGASEHDVAMMKKIMASVVANGDEVKIEDTGDNMPDGGRVIVLKARGHKCFIVLHPTEELMAVLGCMPLDPGEAGT